MPALQFPADLLLRAQGIKLALFDVDGVLTDGALYLEADGERLKRFHILDGLGLKLLKRGGIMPAVVTGRDSPALRARLAALGVEHVRFGREDKRAAAEELLAQMRLSWSDMAAIGDDWPDLPVLRHCAFAVAPPGAHGEVHAVAHYITRAAAGSGAAREFCDLLIMAAGRYVDLLEGYS